MKNNIIIRKALMSDIPDIVRLLSDDMLGKNREQFGNNIPQNYQPG